MSVLLLGFAITGCGSQSDEGRGTGGDATCKELYKGETITFTVPFSAGGGYDAFARLTAPYIEEELDATVVVENKPGAGGLLAINSLISKPADGMTISLMDGVGAGGATIADDAGAKFSLEELTYLGRLGASPHLLTTGKNSEYKNVKDVLSADHFVFGATGPGGADYVNASVLIEVLDLDAEIVTGFKGSAEVEVAVTRGDLDGTTGDFDSRVLAVERGDHRALLLIGRERVDELPDVPSVMELDMDDEERAIMGSQLDLLDLGRVVVGPPEMPKAQTRCLRDALEAATSDPSLRKDAAAQSRPINYMSGHELEKVIDRIQEAPPGFVAVMKDAYATS